MAGCTGTWAGGGLAVQAAVNSSQRIARLIHTSRVPTAAAEASSGLSDRPMTLVPPSRSAPRPTAPMIMPWIRSRRGTRTRAVKRKISDTSSASSAPASSTAAICSST